MSQEWIGENRHRDDLANPEFRRKLTAHFGAFIEGPPQQVSYLPHLKSFSAENLAAAGYVGLYQEKQLMT